MNAKWKFTVTLALLLVTPQIRADDRVLLSKPTAERVRLVRQMYEMLPSDILGIAEPLTELKTRVASDGGSVGIDVRGAKDGMLHIGLDRRLGSKTHDLLLGKLRLPTRGPEESAIYGLLLRWLAKPPENASKADVEVVEQVLKELDQRIAGAVPVAETQTDK